MDLKLDIKDSYEKTEIIIKAPKHSTKIDQLMTMIQQFFNTLSIQKGSKTLQLNILEIVYIESIERKTFFYTKDKIYEDARPLYELEKLLESYQFVRINKQTILNPRFIQSVKALLNSRYEITLETDEKLIVTRHYREAFKKLFEKGGMYDA